MTLALLLALTAVAGRATPAPAGPSGPAGAAPAGPVRVDAREVKYAFQKREVVFTGEPVTLTHDDARLTCRRLVARTDEQGEIVVAVCEGDVTFARGPRRVTCARATYDAQRERLVCEGSPILYDGGSEARGTRLVYDLAADEARLEGAQVTLPGAEVEARRKALEAERARKRAEAGK